MLWLCGAEPFDFNTTDRLDDDSNSRLEFERSYKCKASQSLNFDKAKDIHPIVYVSQLHVQAFHFKNQTGFDNGKSNCSNFTDDNIYVRRGDFVFQHEHVYWTPLARPTR